MVDTTTPLRALRRDPTALPRRAMTRAEAWGIAVFGGWSIVGLHLDGWAHRTDKQETFFTPWHGVLYSGVAAAIAYFVVLGQRQAKQGITGPAEGERLTVVGMAIFGFGAVGDFAWHAVFGIEQDVEALLSPSHLALMIGGVLALAGPLRGAARILVPDRAATYREALPVLLSTAWAISVAGFFLMFTSPFVYEHFSRPWRPDDATAEVLVSFGAATVLVFTALLFGGLALLARRVRLPMWSATTVLGALGVLQVGLDGFERWPVAIAAVIGGVAVDGVARWKGWDRTDLAFGAGALAAWPAFFALVAATDGLGWSVELWSGVVVLATLTAAGIGVLGRRPTPAPLAA